MSRRAYLIAALAAGAVAALAFVTLVAVWPSLGAPSFRPAPGAGATSLGEWVYLRGRDEEGRIIPRTRGAMMGMMGGGCAGCHGVDGRGRSTPMFVAPDITYDNLTDPRGMVAPDGERHETFTDDDIRRAIVDGVDPDGEPLAPPMPRWALSDVEVEALIDHLQTLR